MSFNYQAIKGALKEAGHLVSEGEAWVASDFTALYQFAKDKFGLLHDKVAYGLAYPAELPTDFPGHPNAGEEAAAVVDTTKQIQAVIVPAASAGVTSLVDTAEASLHAAILEARVLAGVATAPAAEAATEEAATPEAPVVEQPAPAPEVVEEVKAPEPAPTPTPAPEVKQEAVPAPTPEVKQDAPAPEVKQDAPAPTPAPEVKEEAKAPAQDAPAADQAPKAE